MTVSDMMAQADNALQQSIKEAKVFHWFENTQKQLFTREEWRNNLGNAIQNKKFQFRWQPIQLSA
ncbi:hypothetical protein PEC18_35600, partial [Paucibacter sp. O1-1]|nr:hypothetical protein [Paucibacter sp. O1-1]MDA3830988.1 hypothetical protein [Paucibacter sp. O1-1]